MLQCKVLLRLPERPIEAGGLGWGAGGLRALGGPAPSSRGAAGRQVAMSALPTGPRMWSRGLGFGGKEGKLQEGKPGKKETSFITSKTEKRGKLVPISSVLTRFGNAFSFLMPQEL